MYKRFHNGITLIGSCLNIDLRPLTREWSRIYESRLQSRGKKDAVKFMKELNTVAERYALRQQIHPIPWTKSDKKGFPRIIRNFKSYLRSPDTHKVIMALSVMRTCEDLRLPISKDLGTITQPSCCDMETQADILNFIPQWVQRLKPLNLPKIKYHYTLKNGPNGHALHESDSDILAVMNDQNLLDAIRVIEGKLRDVYPMEVRALPVKEGPLIHSKLTQFPEKAGKTRTIAIIDYYSQRCLKPLHESVMSLLSSLVSDGTYSHQNVGKYAQLKTQDKSYVYCADLTAFTDRFPAELQRVLLFAILKDDDLARALWTLLAERTFTVAWSGEQISYQCGQPMGAYASWPICSLAHHLVVEYAAYKAGYQQYDDYRLIGDDVIIAERNVAENYQDIIRRLGVEINLGKTVCSTEASEYSGAEVAKQIYLNGICLTPLTPGYVRNFWKPHMFNTCVGILKGRYEFFRANTPSMLIDKFYPKKGKTRKLVWLLASNPINGTIMPGEPGCDCESPWISFNKDEVQENYYKVVHRSLMRATMTMTDRILEMPMSTGSPWKDNTRPQPRCLFYVFKDVSKQLREIQYRLSDPFAEDDLEELVAEFDFIPDPFLPYMERREMRQKRISSMIVSLYEYDENEDMFDMPGW